nr:hypothetical protein [Tanacetum cinerariifolium]
EELLADHKIGRQLCLLSILCRSPKANLSIRPATKDKEMELWVELKRMYEPDPEDQL